VRGSGGAYGKAFDAGGFYRNDSVLVLQYTVDQQEALA